MAGDITGITRDIEVSINSTVVVLEGDNPDGSYVKKASPGTTNAYMRFMYATNTTSTADRLFTTVTGPVTVYQPYSIGAATYGWPGDTTITNLSTGTTYFYVIQGNTTNVTTSTLWEDTRSGGWFGNGEFLTLTEAAVPPVVSITATPDTGYAPLDVVGHYSTMSGTEPAPPLNQITWDWGDGTPAEDFVAETKRGVSYTWFAPQHTYVVESVYTITATGTNAAGTDTATTEVSIVTPVVTASWSSSTVAGTDREVVLTLTDESFSNWTTGNPVEQRLWTLGYPDATTVTYAAPVVTVTVGTNVTEVGSYGLTLTATAVLGQTASATNTELLWVSYLSPTPTITAAPLLAGINDTVTVYASILGDYVEDSKVWSFGDTATSTSSALSVTHVYTAAGVYDLGLVVTASTTGTVATTTSTSLEDYVTVVDTIGYTKTLGGVLREIQNHLLSDPDELPCSAFGEFGGVDNVLDLYYHRLHEFLKLTKLSLTEATLAADTGGVYPLPSDCIEVVRVEVEGLAVQPLDAKVADLWESGWETGTSDAYGYILEPEDSLTLRLVPKLTGKTVKVLYVAAATKASTPSDCLDWASLPLPRAFSWAIKWGVLADLLGQEGEMNDPVRAAFAEELYAMGVQLATLLFLRGVKNV